MKKLLLASTSLAVLAYAGSAMADDVYKEYDGSAPVVADDTGHQHSATRISFTGDTTIGSDDVQKVTLGEYVTLHNPVTLSNGVSEGTARLNINGYLTVTDASDISAITVAINKASVYNSADELVNEGELVIGADLTVGHVLMDKGTGLFAYDDATLNVAADKILYFRGDNYIAGLDGKVLEITPAVGNGGILNAGKLDLRNKVQFGTLANIGEIVVNAGAADTYFAGDFANHGTLTLASNAQTMGIDNHGIIDLQDNELDGGVIAYEGSTVKSLISNVDEDTPANTKYGHITGALTLGDDQETANIEVSVAKGVVIPDEGLELDFANSIADGIVLKDGMYKITSDGSGTLLVENKSLAEKTETLKAVGGNGNNVSAFDAWDKADLTSAPDAIQALQQAIAEASGDAAQLVGILKEITPESPTVVAGAAVSGVTNTMGVIGANAFAGAAPTGKSSGDPKLKNAVWAQGLYNKAEFNKTGYDWDAETWGFAAGADHTFDGGFKLGAGYSYTDADIKTDSSKTPAKTHTIFAYGEYKPGKTWYVNGILSYSFGEYKPKSGTVTGEYDVNTFGAQLMGGYSFDWITPEAGLRYFHVNQDSYTDSIGQKIGKSTSNIWTAVIGAKASKEFKVDSMKLIPEARLAATYDLKQGEDVTTVGVFGTNYEVKGKNLSRFGFEVGAGLTADWGAFELTAKYEGKFRSDYTDNTGILEAKYNF